MNSFLDWLTNYFYYCLILAIATGVGVVLVVIMREWDTRKNEDAKPIKTSTLGMK